MRKSSFTSSDKSYGGYSTHSLPTRNAESEEEKKRDVPDYVSKKVEEIKEKQKEEDEGKAWAVAWSIYCKYKDPKSKHCKKTKDEYFPSRSKKAYESRDEEVKVKRTTLLLASILDEWVSKGLLEAIKIIKSHAGADNTRMLNLVMYMWTTGKYPMFLLKYGKEAQIIGKLSADVHLENRPENVTFAEERQALKILVEVFKYFYQIWSSHVWAKLWLKSDGIEWATIRLEMVNLRNRIEYGYHYTRLLRVMFPD
jgi:hypothetical protein